MESRPFLLRFMKDTKKKASEKSDSEYDESLDMTMVFEDGKRIPAIHAIHDHSLKTQKADLEKGEDQKDDF